MGLIVWNLNDKKIKLFKIYVINMVLFNIYVELIDKILNWIFIKIIL